MTLRVKGRPNYYSTKRHEYAIIKFDLDADFTSLFTWNTKQLFVWVTAEYPSSTSGVPASEAVIWDLIIQSEAQKKAPDWSGYAATVGTYLPNDWVKKMGLPKPKREPKYPLKSKKDQKKKARDWTVPDPNAQPGILQLRNVKPKYQITDISGSLAEQQNVTLKVGWNIQPWVGAMQWSWTTEFVTPIEGVSHQSQKGLLSGGIWKWRPMNGGISEIFDLPTLPGAVKKKETVKAAPPAADETILSHGEMPEAGEAKKVVDV